VKSKYVGSGVTADTSVICEEFCTFFESIYGPKPDRFPDLVFNPRGENTMGDLVLSREDVVDAILSCPDKPSLGADGLSYVFYKKCVDYVWLPLQIIFLLSIQFGCIPDEWKLSKVAPVHKKGSKIHVENFRPVSQTVVACRILERIVRKHILNFLTENKLIGSNQHGFLPRRSTFFWTL
jgi:hypothetical protein